MLNHSTPYIRRAWYGETIDVFLRQPTEHIVGELARNSPFSILQSQTDAWLQQIEILRRALAGYTGKVYFEFIIPRMGHRVDSIVLIDGLVLAIEFKIEAK
ncbi:MAG: hypothetical protein HUU46_09145 [Candidatus Hydrogenedentes bacterium]|nr:hypothetical protein [Candidatus Hydrogenedentota bacterium]